MERVSLPVPVSIILGFTPPDIDDDPPKGPKCSESLPAPETILELNEPRLNTIESLPLPEVSVDE